MQDAQVYQIDENGYLIDILLVPENTLLTERVQVGEEPIFDDEGNEVGTEPIYEIRPRVDIIYERPPDGLFDPRWNGEEWVNGLSEAEIDEMRNRPVPLTPQEQKIQDLEVESLQLKLALAESEESRLQDSLETKLAIAELAEIVLEV